MRSADRVNQGSVSIAGDYHDLERVQSDLDRVLEDMARSIDGYANAKAMLEFTGERKRDALAAAFVQVRDGNQKESAVVIEQLARKTPGWKEAHERLLKDEMTAECIVANYHLLQTRSEVLRSYLVIEREKLRLV